MNASADKATRKVSPDAEITGLHLWLQSETDPAKRAEISVLLARRLRWFGLWGPARAVLEAAPPHAFVDRSLGLEYFRQGRIADGLALYDRGRWQLPEMDKLRRGFPFPFWNGQALAGKRLLVWAEQGIGDQVMQARCLDALVRRGAEVTVECDPRLIPMLQPGAEGVRFVAQTVAPDASLAQGFDFQTSMLSAWRWIDAPHEGACCLQADPQHVARYRRAWQGLPHRINVGLSWHSAAPQTGAARSIDLELLRGFAGSAQVNFHSLQYGDWDLAAQSKALGAPLLSQQGLDLKADLHLLAAQIAALDLVITIDNATAHLAGALGVPCWVLLPRSSEWRWGTRANSTPLYDSIRLFRAQDRDHWTSAVWPLGLAFAEWQAGQGT